MVAERVGVIDGETVLVTSAVLKVLKVTSADGLMLAVPVADDVWLVLPESDCVAATLIDAVWLLEVAAEDVTDADAVPVRENDREELGVDK
jgi:hypothetical protein